MQLYFALKNIFKIIYWIFILIALLNYLGVVYGAFVFIALCFVWNIVLTGTWERKIANKSLLDIIFSRAALPFTVYGCYCSPGYGSDGKTKNLDPIDQLDVACKRHDEDMLYINQQMDDGLITRSDYVRLKNHGDWKFMKRAIVSENASSGLYLVGLEAGFLFRILKRTL